MSEQPDGSPPVRWSFLARNRLIAALAQSVVVVQAPFRSGALSTAAVAIKLNKPVFSVPYAPWDVAAKVVSSCSGGGHGFALRTEMSYPYRLAGSAKGKASAHLAEMGAVQETPGQAWPEQPPDGEHLIRVNDLDAETRVVLEGLSRVAKHPDELSSALGLPAMKVQRALLQLLLHGLAVERAPGRYARNPGSDQK